MHNTYNMLEPTSSSTDINTASAAISSLRFTKNLNMVAPAVQLDPKANSVQQRQHIRAHTTT
eukprot:1154199-Pelagomonas_calceolata.AAC.7